MPLRPRFAIPYHGPLVVLLASACRTPPGPSSTSAPVTSAASAASAYPDKTPPTAPEATSAASVRPLSDNELRVLADAGHSFAARLYDAIGPGRDNLFFSPASIRIALGMTYAGARGETATEIAHAAGFAGPPAAVHQGFAAALARWNARTTTPDAPAFTLRVANRLWAQQGHPFADDFRATLASNYGAPLGKLDFAHNAEAGRAAINTWVAEATSNKIRDLLTPGAITPLTKLVLTNAIYFKAAWAQPFRASVTRDAPFSTAAGKAVSARTMHQTTDFGYGEVDGAQVLTMPYAGGPMSFVAVLPAVGKTVDSIEHAFAEKGLSRWAESTQTRRVDVALPQFKIAGATLSLKPMLRKLGIRVAFTDRADFSGIDGTRDLELADVLHKAFVDVDENGTEAAAATAAIVATKGMPMAPPTAAVFHADRPFLFFIRDTGTGDVLFVGRVDDPTR